MLEGEEDCKISGHERHNPHLSADDDADLSVTEESEGHDIVFLGVQGLQCELRCQDSQPPFWSLSPCPLQSYNLGLEGIDLMKQQAHLQHNHETKEQSNTPASLPP